MTEQSRVPPGDPRGGQFASSPRPEAETVLDQVYRDDEGSFHYPPAPDTYDKLLKFWSNVEIPEDVLTRFQRGYNQSVDARVLAQVRQWEAENPAPRSERHQARWQAERAQLERDLVGREPALYNPWVRPLVRLDRMYAYRAGLYPSEREKFLAQQYSLPGGSTAPTGTVEELLDMFHVADYRHVLRETSIDDNEKLLEQLRRTTLELRNIRSGV